MFTHEYEVAPHTYLDKPQRQNGFLPLHCSIPTLSGHMPVMLITRRWVYRLSDLNQSWLDLLVDVAARRMWPISLQITASIIATALGSQLG